MPSSATSAGGRSRLAGPPPLPRRALGRSLCFALLLVLVAPGVVLATPSNDDFADAQVISGSSAEVVGTNAGATGEPGEPYHVNDPGPIESVWYRWTAPGNGELTVTTCGELFSPRHEIYTGSSVDSLATVGIGGDECWDPATTGYFGVRAGTTYQIAVDGFGDGEGEFTLTLEFDELLNDDLTDAQAISGSSVFRYGSTFGATGEPDEPNHAAASSPIESVWYRWVAPADGKVTLGSCGYDGFDPTLAAYTGASVGALTELGSSADPCGSAGAVVFGAISGSTYVIAVDGLGNGEGSFTLTLGFDLVSPPPAEPYNDAFAEAHVIEGTFGSLYLEGWNLGATGETGEPDHAGISSPLASVWYRWTAPEAGRVTIDTCEAFEFESALGVYTGTAVHDLTPVAAGGGCAAEGSVQFDVSAGTTYHIAIDGQRDEQGSFMLTAQFAVPLDVAKAGNGSGTVVSSPDGIDCGSDCSHTYDHGTSVTLTATPATGSKFTRWEGCTGTTTCTVTMDGAKSVTAVFELRRFALEVTKAGTGGGTVTSSPAGIDCGTDCSETHDHGTSVTLSATADADSTFTGWSGACTGTGACTVTVDDERSVTATFADTRGPTNPTLSSPSHRVATWSADRTVQVDFAGAVDRSGVDGFSFVWDNVSGTVPDRTKEADASVTSITSEPLTDGRHYFHLRAVDALGNWSDPVELGPFLIDGTRPSASVGSLGVFQRETRFTVRWSGADTHSGIASYNVRFRRAAWNGTFGTVSAFQTGTTATSAVFSGAAGNTYCFSAQARDRAGNDSVWTTERCTALPLDDRSLSRSTGWTRATGSTYYLATITRSSTVGSRLTRTGVQARRLAVLATRCATCGTIQLYWRGALVKEASLYAPTTLRRQVVAVVLLPSVQPGTVVIRVKSYGRRVEIDGLGVSRS